MRRHKKRLVFCQLAEYLTFQKIVEADYQLPEGLSDPAADLIHRLLQVDPVQRIGKPS